MASLGTALKIPWFTVLILCFLKATNAALICRSTAFCETKLRPGSECLDGICTNPYHRKGCLAQRLPDWPQYRIRVCHSEDPPEAELLGYCRPPDSDLNYQEIRILTQNWESAFFQAWIIQIVLSEILGIPVTLESGTPDKLVDFYHYQSPLGYGMSYDYDALERANDYVDCRLLDKYDSDGNYVSCGHVMTEVWNGNQKSTDELWQGKNIIERPGLMGALGYQGLFIPVHTAEKDPTLLTHLGLVGQANRRKLAETFLRPTTWQEYCSLISLSNCSLADDVAQRPPQSSAEGGRYFVEELYQGHFRFAETNDCDRHPKNCTGVVVDYPCGWTSFVQQQFHHLDIALESKGSEPVSNGYSYSEMTEIWGAANATKSNVMIRWWTPEALYQTFLGTDSEFHAVSLPPPTQDCVRARINLDHRCSKDVPDELRLGSGDGSCEEPPFSLQRLVVQSLKDSADDPRVPEETRSPAYETIKNIKLDELQLGKIFDYWLKRNSDRFNFDPRDASCRWVVENFDFIKTFVPKTYPRVVVEQEESSGALFYTSLSLSLLALASVLFAVAGTVRHRRKRAVRFAQVEFLYVLLTGLFMIALASVILNVPTSNASCMSVHWLILQGYTFELVPLILKIAAVAHMVAAAKKFKRVRLEKKRLFTFVLSISALLVVYLICWTLLDPSKKTSNFELTTENTEQGETIVVRSSYCRSDSAAWLFVSIGWHGLLLLCGTVLAIQTRNLRREVNESLPLAVLVYSHAIFVTLRMILYYLGESFDIWKVSSYQSMIFSVDVISACFIYFFPKFLPEYDPKSTVMNFPIIQNISKVFLGPGGEDEAPEELNVSASGNEGEISSRESPIHSRRGDSTKTLSTGKLSKGHDSMSVLQGDSSFLIGEDSVQHFQGSRIRQLRNQPLFEFFDNESLAEHSSSRFPQHRSQDFLLSSQRSSQRQRSSLSSWAEECVETQDETLETTRTDDVSGAEGGGQPEDASTHEWESPDESIQSTRIDAASAVQGGEEANNGSNLSKLRWSIESQNQRQATERAKRRSFPSIRPNLDWKDEIRDEVSI